MFEKFMKKSDDCCKLAIDYLKKGELDMALFYKNASIGFKKKALDLIIE
jgi:hypothetical protein